MSKRKIPKKDKYKEKKQAVKALEKFRKMHSYKKDLNSDSNHQRKGTSVRNKTKLTKNNSSPKSSSLSQNMQKSNQVFHLILSNLPRNYTVDDVKILVEEAKPVCINELEQTRVLHLKFCHIVLDSAENLNYLINKLNGFILKGEKLLAVEAKSLLDWKDKMY